MVKVLLQRVVADTERELRSLENSFYWDPQYIFLLYVVRLVERMRMRLCNGCDLEQDEEEYELSRDDYTWKGNRFTSEIVR